VELLSGVIFFVLVYRYGLTLNACRMCLFSAIMVALFFSDLEERILPDEFTVWGTVVGLVFAAFSPTRGATAYFLLSIVGLDNHGWISRFLAAAISAGLPAGLLWAVAWMYLKVRNREGLGLGDIKMVALLGCYLGLEAALFTLVLGSIAGTVLGLAYIKATGKDASTYELPFGTFLSGAALIAVLFSPQLFGW
jgi:leader peptidase (prepilin peptidase)/N-methyltransferase